MGKLRFVFALLAGKCAAFLLRIIGRGSNIPGVIMQKICPDALGRFKMPKLVICVTGTNGKTGTSNLVTHLLRCGGMKVANNSEGSNMVSGLLTTLAIHSGMNGAVKADAAVLEVDERSSPYIYPHFKPDYILCTNLFRDSIKRNGHSEYIFDKINDYIPDGTVLLLNGNDPISGLLGGEKNEKVFFCVDKTSESTEVCENRVCDCRSCPNCHKPLHFEFYHYHHIGQPVCDCGFSMRASAFTGKNVDFQAGTFDFCTADGGSVNLPFSGKNLFNVFNVTAAAAISMLAGISLDTIRDGVFSFTNAKGRFEETEASGKRIVTMLCKNQNPVSSSQSIAYLNRVSGTKDVVLLITDSKDAHHGSEDISWLYDVDFSCLAGEDVHKVILGGTRCEDLALCLTLAGVDRSKLELFHDYDALCRAVPELVAQNGTTVVYYELYALQIAQRVRSALSSKEAAGK